MAGENNPFAKYVGTGAAPPSRQQPGPRVQNIPQFPDERPRPRPRAPEPVARPAPVAPPVAATPPAEPETENPFAKFVGKSIKPATAEKTDPLADLDVTGDYADVRKSIAGLPEQHRKAALDKWADSVVAKERENSGVGQTVEDYMRRAATGVVGGWGDRLGAKISSVIGGADYDEALAKEQAQSRAAVKNTLTKLGTLPMIGDVTTGDLAGLAGGIAAAPLVPVAPVARAVPYLASAPASMAARMVNTGATGAAVGGAVGYGSGNTDQERAENARHAALVGGAVGAAIPPAASAIGNVAGRVANTAVGLPQGVQNYSRRAVDRMARDFEADNSVNPINTATYGPEGMLADMGPSMRGTTGALRALPGEQQAVIDAALIPRRQGAQGRITADMDATLGPAQNLVQLEENVVGAANRNARPLYEQFRQSQIPYTPDLVNILHSVPESAIRKASELARAERVDITRPEALPQLLDYIKRGIDDVAREAGRGTNLHRVYSNLARDLRNEVDRALSPNDPTQSVYAQARRASGEGMQFREGLEEGQGAFSKGTHPDQMAADLARTRGTPYEAGYVAGARGQIRDIMGNAAAAYGPNGDIAALKNLNAPYAQQKFEALVGPQAGARLGGRLRAEAAMNRTYNEVESNSLTAQRLNAKEGLPNPRANGGADIPTSPAGLAMSTAARIVDHLTAGVVSARNQQMLREIAEMAVAQGARREQIAYALRQYLQHGTVVAQARPAIARLATDILRGSTTALPGNRDANRRQIAAPVN